MQLLHYHKFFLLIRIVLLEELMIKKKGKNLDNVSAFINDDTEISENKICIKGQLVY